MMRSRMAGTASVAFNLLTSIAHPMSFGTVTAYGAAMAIAAAR